MAEASSIENQKIEQYKAYMQDVANIGSRHETARGFYLSVLTALLAFVALSGKDGPLNGIGANLFIVLSLRCHCHLRSLASAHFIVFRPLPRQTRAVAQDGGKTSVPDFHCRI